jgi:hypothetical protein
MKNKEEPSADWSRGNPAKARSVDTTPTSDVLLEALAVSPHTPPGANPSGCSASPSDSTRSQPQRPLAHGQNHRQWRRDAERLVTRSRTSQLEDSVGGTCSASSNRLVRSRMLGGGVPGNGRPYPIIRPSCHRRA